MGDMSATELQEKLKGIGASEVDSNLVVSCLVNRCSYMWTNTDPVNDDLVGKINAFLKERDLPLFVKITPVRMQDKFIWEVKHLAPSPPPEPEGFKPFSFL